MTEEKRSRVLGMILASVSRGVFPQRYLYGHVAKDGETVPDGLIKCTINGTDYVGAVLPQLPEWDKKKHPYALIAYYNCDQKESGSRCARLICSSEPILYTHKRMGLVKVGYEVLGDIRCFGLVTHDVLWDWFFDQKKPYPPINEWVFDVDKECGEHYDERTVIFSTLPNTSSVVDAYMYLIWSNHDVYCTEDSIDRPDQNVLAGKLYHSEAESEYIPIFE